MLACTCRGFEASDERLLAALAELKATATELRGDMEAGLRAQGADVIAARVEIEASLERAQAELKASLEDSKVRGWGMA